MNTVYGINIKGPTRLCHKKTMSLPKGDKYLGEKLETRPQEQELLNQNILKTSLQTAPGLSQVQVELQKEVYLVLI